MTAIMDMLFKSDEDRIVLSTYSGNYRSKDIKERVKYYLNILENLDVERKKIGILVPTIPSYLAIVLAVNQLGGTVVPLSWQYRKEDLSAVLNFINPHIVFTTKEFNGFSFGEEVHNWAVNLDEETIIFDGDDNENWNETKYEGKVKALEAKRIGFIISSSGSTGTPKGMVLPDNTLDHAFKQLSSQTEVKPTDSVLFNAPPTALFGIATLLYGIYSGAKAVFPESFEMGKMVKLLEENQCNKVLTTPSIFKAIYQIAKEINPETVKNFELIGLSGEKISKDYVQQFDLMKNCKFIGMYGSSEAGGVGYCNIRHDDAYTLYEGNEYKIQDSELLVKTPAAFVEYYKNPVLTSTVLDSDGWVATGDTAIITKERKIKIIGRKKDMIKKGGQQVIPGEVEQVLISHPAVQNAVVIGEKHDVYGEQIIAFVLVENEVDTKQLTYYCSQKIAGYKAPDEIYTVREIPVSQGKVDKVSLRKIYKEIKEINK